MAVAKDRMASSNTFMLEGSSTPSSPLHFLNLSSLSSSSNFYIFEDDNYPKQLSPHREDDNKSPSPPLSSSSSVNYSNGFGAHHEPDLADHRSLLNYGGSSLVNFQPQGRSHNFAGGDQPNHDEYNPMWEDSSIDGNDPQHLKLTSEWLYEDGNESHTQQLTSVNNKRNLMEDDNFKTTKKQCTSNGSSSKKQPSKSKSSTITSKDPQSVAAKNRRERISERLKILQDLVPNGSKVDMVTMLDKAISYVKFLQLQAKVLATDEFWPAAGGKPPNISQVKEAIDAILRSSQRDSPSSSIDRNI